MPKALAASNAKFADKHFKLFLRVTRLEELSEDKISLDTSNDRESTFGPPFPTHSFTDITDAERALVGGFPRGASRLADLQQRFKVTFCPRPSLPPQSTVGQRNEYYKLYHKVLVPNQIYNQALSTSCYFFIAFAFCISQRACEHKKLAPILQHKDAASCYFRVEEYTIDLFNQWANEDGYADQPPFLDFIDALTRGNKQSSTESELKLVRKILQGTPKEDDLVDSLFLACLYPFYYK
ncbi:hypothetical protein G7Y89_g5431 [Cudoniella acicularis]|uniref:Uncharacterized protein n=1 Tax=Cudoniella acicularis TaxID=354080 RepID=A0A8H4RPR5_9HELO|nr:hypothetical protein G7Y89_g5431 [Cudoniella acicularis]